MKRVTVCSVFAALFQLVLSLQSQPQPLGFKIANKVSKSVDRKAEASSLIIGDPRPSLSSNNTLNPWLYRYPPWFVPHNPLPPGVNEYNNKLKFSELINFPANAKDDIVIQTSALNHHLDVHNNDVRVPNIANFKDELIQTIIEKSFEKLAVKDPNFKKTVFSQFSHKKQAPAIPNSVAKSFAKNKVISTKAPVLWVPSSAPAFSSPVSSLHQLSRFSGNLESVVKHHRKKSPIFLTKFDYFRPSALISIKQVKEGGNSNEFLDAFKPHVRKASGGIWSPSYVSPPELSIHKDKKQHPIGVWIPNTPPSLVKSDSRKTRHEPKVSQVKSVEGQLKTTLSHPKSIQDIIAGNYDTAEVLHNRAQKYENLTRGGGVSKPEKWIWEY